MTRKNKELTDLVAPQTWVELEGEGRVFFMGRHKSKKDRRKYLIFVGVHSPLVMYAVPLGALLENPIGSNKFIITRNYERGEYNPDKYNLPDENKIRELLGNR